MDGNFDEFAAMIAGALPGGAIAHQIAHDELTVTVDDNGSVTVTTATGQSRTVTPYDYRMTEDPEPSAAPVVLGGVQAAS